MDEFCDAKSEDNVYSGFRTEKLIGDEIDCDE